MWVAQARTKKIFIRTQVTASKMEEEDCIQEIRLGIIKKIEIILENLVVGFKD